MNRSVTRVRVTVNYPTDTLPLAVFRSMFVTEGNADADHVEWLDATGALRNDPILTFPGNTGTEWLFRRQTRSRHNTSAPDIRIKLASVKRAALLTSDFVLHVPALSFNGGCSGRT